MSESVSSPAAAPVQAQSSASAASASVSLNLQHPIPLRRPHVNSAGQHYSTDTPAHQKQQQKQSQHQQQLQSHSHSRSYSQSNSFDPSLLSNSHSNLNQLQLHLQNQHQNQQQYNHSNNINNPISSIPIPNPIINPNSASASSSSVYPSNSPLGLNFVSYPPSNMFPFQFSNAAMANNGSATRFQFIVPNNQRFQTANQHSPLYSYSGQYFSPPAHSNSQFANANANMNLLQNNAAAAAVANHNSLSLSEANRMIASFPGFLAAANSAHTGGGHRTLSAVPMPAISIASHNSANSNSDQRIYLNSQVHPSLMNVPHSLAFPSHSIPSAAAHIAPVTIGISKLGSLTMGIPAEPQFANSMPAAAVAASSPQQSNPTLNPILNRRIRRRRRDPLSCRAFVLNFMASRGPMMVRQRLGWLALRDLLIENYSEIACQKKTKRLRPLLFSLSYVRELANEAGFKLTAHNGLEGKSTEDGEEINEQNKRKRSRQEMEEDQQEREEAETAADEESLTADELEADPLPEPEPDSEPARTESLCITEIVNEIQEKSKSSKLNNDNNNTNTNVTVDVADSDTPVTAAAAAAIPVSTTENRTENFGKVI